MVIALIKKDYYNYYCNNNYYFGVCVRSFGQKCLVTKHKLNVNISLSTTILKVKSGTHTQELV